VSAKGTVGWLAPLFPTPRPTVISLIAVRALGWQLDIVYDYRRPEKSRKTKAAAAERESGISAIAGWALLRLATFFSTYAL
jgi:hypothetical protein